MSSLNLNPAKRRTDKNKNLNIHVLKFSAVLLLLTACHKSNNTATRTGQSFDSLETDVIIDFTNNVVAFRYSSLLNSGYFLQTGINKLATETNDENLTAAKVL